jgi:phosphohistidine phosphatase
VEIFSHCGKCDVKRLLILRHAKSSWSDSSLDDWQRPLNDRGERDAPRVGDLIKRQSLVPDLIITSDAERARTTAQAVARRAGYAREMIFEPALYHAGPEDVISVINGVANDVNTVLIVGHNPGLENLVQQLTGEDVTLPTAALVHISLPIDRWSDLDGDTGGSIVDSWRPADLPG